MKIELKGSGDALQVRESGQVVSGFTIEDKADSKTKEKPHRDGIQLIPERKIGTFNTQFSGAIIRGVIIKNNVIKSDGKLQCIFCSDGGVEDTNIENNTLDTNGQHYISLSLLSGTIKNNRDSSGNLVPIRLFPLRIGGNSDGAYNVYILTFKQEQYSYKPVDEIVKDETLNHVTDHRFGFGKRKNSIYLYDFDYDGFVVEAEKEQLTANQMRELALRFGSQTEPSKQTIKIPDGEGMARGIRNCNPGNIEASPTNKWMGLASREEMTEEQKQETRFCVFKSPVYGIRALAKLLQNYQSRYKLKSIKTIIARYAPRQDNNNTDAYVRVVAQAVGVADTDTISMFDYDTARAVVVAIIEHENGIANPYTEDEIRQGLAMAGVSMPEELRDQRPLSSSREMVTGGTVVGGSTLAAGAEVYKRYTEEPVQPETETIKTIEDGIVTDIEVVKPVTEHIPVSIIDTISTVDMVQLVVLCIIAFAAIDWILDRRLTKKLGLR